MSEVMDGLVVTTDLCHFFYISNVYVGLHSSCVKLYIVILLEPLGREPLANCGCMSSFLHNTLPNLPPPDQEAVVQGSLQLVVPHSNLSGMIGQAVTWAEFS